MLKTPVLILIGLFFFQLGAFPVYAQRDEGSSRIGGEAGEEMPHMLALKVGLHLYPGSKYFDTTAPFFDENDLTSVAAEIEYDYLWYPPSSLGFAIGYYDGQGDFGTICCSKVAFSTVYGLLTLKFHTNLKPAKLGPVRVYAGTGIGYYLFNREIRVVDIRDEFLERIFGFHFLLGAESPLNSRLGLFAEVRYSSVAIPSANEFNDELNIGGMTTFFGVSWRFPDFAHFFRSSRP